MRGSGFNSSSSLGSASPLDPSPAPDPMLLHAHAPVDTSLTCRACRCLLLCLRWASLSLYSAAKLSCAVVYLRPPLRLRWTWHFFSGAASLLRLEAPWACRWCDRGKHSANCFGNYPICHSMRIKSHSKASHRSSVAHSVYVGTERVKA
jgi:hypothetical protein